MQIRILIQYQRFQTFLIELEINIIRAATQASTKINIIQADSVLASLSISLVLNSSSALIASDFCDDGIIPETKL